MSEDVGSPPRKWLRVSRTTPWSEELAEAICERVAAGELLYEVCRAEGMPTPQSVARWARERPAFARALAEARRRGGRTAQGGGVWRYCEETANLIFERLCEGESLTTICKDAEMPAISTVYHWRKRFPEFNAMLRLAREIQAELFCDTAMQMAREATPETAYLTHVRLTHLRWSAGTMAPHAYRTKPAEAPRPPEEVKVLFRGFKIERDPETGKDKVVAYCPNPYTGRLEREDEPGWRPPEDCTLLAGGFIKD
jgi:hypothetical protein